PAPTLSRPNHPGIRSTVYNFQIPDYVPWQRSKQKTKPSTTTLPPVLQTRGHQKSTTKTLTSVLPGLYSKPTMLMTSQLRNPQEKHRGKLDSEKAQAKIQLMRTLLRNRRTSLQELRSHEVFLTKLNWELIKSIQDMEESSAQKVRAMLQQQDSLATVIDILEYLNKKKLQKLRCELKEWEEKEESKMKHLAQQVEQLNAKIENTYKEVNFLSTYMDHEYPIKSVQIANLTRQLQQIKDSQQDELDELNEMRRMVLEYLSNQIQKKKKKLLKALVVKSQQPHQEALLKKTRDSQYMLKCTDKFREFIHQFEEEIPILKAQVEQLQVQVQEPREIIFADVLLRRPKCTPDMDVILNIPVEELLPF
uniref:Chromosome 20 open reading frame 96 n=1 Tax=Canis lupus dingo TaxID=286419 RepID=A0A8C0JT83_CANLU